MKLKKLSKTVTALALACVMAFLFTACSSTGKVSPKENAPENVQADDGYQSDFFNGMVTGSPEGYYFCEPMNFGYVSFFDKNSKKIVPLCGKADCSHNSVNCDAYFPNETFGVLNMQYDNGYLYRVGRSETDECVPEIHGRSQRGAEAGGSKADSGTFEAGASV